MEYVIGALAFSIVLVFGGLAAAIFCKPLEWMEHRRKLKEGWKVSGVRDGTTHQEGRVVIVVYAKTAADGRVLRKQAEFGGIVPGWAVNAEVTFVPPPEQKKEDGKKIPTPRPLPAADELPAPPVPAEDTAPHLRIAETAGAETMPAPEPATDPEPRRKKPTKK